MTANSVELWPSPALPSETLLAIVKQVRESLSDYADVVYDSDLAQSSKDTYFLYASNFVRWLEDDFEPGEYVRDR